MQRLRIHLVDDHDISLAGLRLLLEQHGDFEIVGQCHDGACAIEHAHTLAPDLILMDIVLPIVDGIEATRQIKASVPNARVLMLTASECEQDIFAALAAGADGYCSKLIAGEHLATAIRSVAMGACWLDPTVADRVLHNSYVDAGEKRGTRMESHGKFALSQREVDVLQEIVNGRSNKEIAVQLTITLDTVKTHIRHIMEKLAVADRTQAAVKALREKLV